MHARTPTATARSGTAGYLLALVVCVVCVHNFDRVGFSIVLEAIKGSLSLSDMQLGLLAGPAFAVLNAAAAFPLARMADRGNRRLILSLCILLWSGCTALGGVAQGFAGIAAARAGAGLADAGASPLSQSLAASAYPGPKRSWALSLLIAGSYCGAILGFAGAGFLQERFGWRTTLVCMGMPGILLGLIVRLTLPEPAEHRGDVEGRAHNVRLVDVIRGRTFGDAVMVVASNAILSWALIAWLPSFLHRRFAMAFTDIGAWLAVAAGAAAAAGTLTGGMLARRLDARRPNAGLWLGFATSFVSTPLLTAAFVTSSKEAALWLIIASYFTGAVCVGPIYASIQAAADVRTRATVAALLGMAGTLLGQAGGPLLVGAISDLAAGRFGADSLRLSLGLVSLLGFWPTLHIWRLARYFPPPPVHGAAREDRIATVEPAGFR